MFWMNPIIWLIKDEFNFVHKFCLIKTSGLLEGAMGAKMNKDDSQKGDREDDYAHICRRSRQINA